MGINQVQNIFRTILAFFFLTGTLYAQITIDCPSPYVFMDGGGFIKYYDPTQPFTQNNPGNTNIPSFGGGLTLMPNINGGTLTPTFYSVSGGNYYYWSGSNWVNTGHSTGNGAAVNLGGCNGAIYNLVGGTGQVYVYNGTSNGTLLTTLQGFNGGGPYDLVTDCDCNFYALNTTTSGAGQSLTKYGPNGTVLQTWTLNNMPNASAGGGFAIICDKVYLKNNMQNGYFIGTITGNVINFVQVNGFTQSPGDFASCPSCNSSTNTLTGFLTNAMLSCTNPTANLIASTLSTPVTYSWSGPGIIGSATSSIVAVGAPGTYSCRIATQGCPIAEVTLTTVVTTNSNVVSAVISPSGNICVPNNSFVTLHVTHTSSTEAVSWSGPGVSGPQTLDSLITNMQGVFSVTVTNTANGCKDVDFVTLVQTPTVSMSLSSTSLCARPYNGSPNTLTITPSGANSYTFYSSAHFSTTANGPLMPVTVLNNISALASGTLVGSNQFCRDTALTTFQIYQNPNISVSAGSVCPGSTYEFTASGASSYNWNGASLNSYTGSIVTSSANVNTTYSVIGTSSGCSSPTYTTSITILPIPTITLFPTSSTICLGSTVALTASGTATSYTWHPAQGLNTTVGSTVIASPPFTHIYTATGALNGCTNIATTTVNVVQPPVVNMSLSTNSICLFNYNNSLNSLTVTPFGANSYTLLSGANYAVNQQFGPTMVVSPNMQPFTGVTVLTLTLVGVIDVCTVSKTHTFAIVANPILTVTPPTGSICPGGSHIFGVTGASTYSWSASASLFPFSPNSVITTPTITSFYSVMGAANGCKSDFKNAILIVMPVPHVLITPVFSTLCAGSAATLTAISNAETITWNPSASLSSTSGHTVQVVPPVTETFTVLATMNTCTNEAVATVSAIPIPTISASVTDKVICSSATTMLKAEGALGYNWYPFENLSAKVGKQVLASPPVSTQFTVWGFNGICSGSTTVFVETVDRPDIKIQPVQNLNVLCYGNSQEVITSGAMHYEWKPANAVWAIGSNTLVSLKPQASTNFTIIGANYNGSVVCAQQVNYSLMVVPKIQPSVSPDVSMCLGEKTTLAALGGNSFKWKPTDGLNMAEGSRVVAGPSVSTVYTVEVSHHSYCATTTTVYVEINPRPTVLAGRDTSYHINDAILVNAAGTGSLNWVSGEGIRCMVCPVTQVYPSQSGCYVVEAKNEYGCTAYDDICINIREDFTVYVPNSFTPNGDGLNDNFTVYGENFSQLNLEVFDRWGALLFSSVDQLKGWDGMYKAELCKPDTYTYKISYTGLDRKRYHLSGQINLIR